MKILISIQIFLKKINFINCSTLSSKFYKLNNKDILFYKKYYNEFINILAGQTKCMEMNKIYKYNKNIIYFLYI